MKKNQDFLNSKCISALQTCFKKAVSKLAKLNYSRLPWNSSLLLIFWGGVPNFETSANQHKPFYLHSKVGYAKIDHGSWQDWYQKPRLLSTSLTSPSSPTIETNLKVDLSQLRSKIFWLDLLKNSENEQKNKATPWSQREWSATTHHAKISLPVVSAQPDQSIHHKLRQGQPGFNEAVMLSTDTTKLFAFWAICQQIPNHPEEKYSMSMSIRRNTYVDIDSSMHCVSIHAFKRLALCHWSNQAVFDPAMPSPQAGGMGPCPSPQCFSHPESCVTKFTLTHEFLSVTKSPQKPARSTAWDAPYHGSVGGSHARPAKRQQPKHWRQVRHRRITPWLDPSLPASSAVARIAWNLIVSGKSPNPNYLSPTAEKRMSCGKEGRPTVAGLVLFLGSNAKQASTCHRI